MKVCVDLYSMFNIKHVKNLAVLTQHSKVKLLNIKQNNSKTHHIIQNLNTHINNPSISIQKLCKLSKNSLSTISMWISVKFHLNTHTYPHKSIIIYYIKKCPNLMRILVILAGTYDKQSTRCVCERGFWLSDCTRPRIKHNWLGVQQELASLPGQQACTATLNSVVAGIRRRVETCALRTTTRQERAAGGCVSVR